MRGLQRGADRGGVPALRRVASRFGLGVQEARRGRGDRAGVHVVEDPVHGGMPRHAGLHLVQPGLAESGPGSGRAHRGTDRAEQASVGQLSIGPPLSGV